VAVGASGRPGQPGPAPWERLGGFDQRLPRYTSYPSAPHFGGSVDAATYRGWLAAVDPDLTASLYLHVPFCAAMCWYCGCHTTVAKDPGRIARYAALLADEIDLVADALPGRLGVSHVHWGGGTPNLLAPADLRRISDRLAARFAGTARSEIAVELDPRTLDRDAVRALADVGVTRASLGVQDFDPRVQAAINRRQPYALVAQAAAWLRDHGIAAINVDLMYGLPHQTPASMARTIAETLTLAPARLALFGYAHVPWLKPHQRRIADAALPTAAARAALYGTAGAALVAAGYRAIGIDHFARPDDALARAAAAGTLRRNFQGYTTDAAPLLIGIGASAIGSLPQGYVQNAAALGDWRAAIAAGRLATRRGHALSADDRLRRDIIERLMCDLRVDLDAACGRHGVGRDRLTVECADVDRLVAGGLGWRDGGRLGVADPDRPLIRAVCAAFDRYLGRAQARHTRLV
jgi:oxygen-independent coproporphyrinogen-3 oxidase